MSQSDSGVKRRGLLKFGSLITAITGASAISAIGATSAEAGPGDKTSSTTYVPMSEKGAPLGVATLDLESKIPPALLPDLSATYVPRSFRIWEDTRDYVAPTYAPGDDATSALQAAVSAAASATGRGMVVVAGDYYVSGTINLTGTAKAVKITSSGAGDHAGFNWHSRIWTDSPTGTVFNLTESGCVFEDIFLENTSATTPTAGAGISGTTVGGLRLNRVTIKGFYINLDVSQAQEWSMTACVVRDWVAYGARISNTFQPDSGDQSISDSWFSFFATAHTGGPAIRWESGGGLKISNTKFNGPGGTFMEKGIEMVLSDTTTDLLVANCSFENIHSHGIDLRQSGTSAATFEHVSLVGNQFARYSTDAASHDIHIAPANGLRPFKNINIVGVFRAGVATQSAVYMSNAENAYIAGTFSGYLRKIQQSACVKVPLEPAGDVMWLAAKDFEASYGAPSLSAVERWPVWLMDSTAQERISAVMPQLPWGTIGGEVWWMNPTAAAGNVVLQMTIDSKGYDGIAAQAGTSSGVTFTATAGVQSSIRRTFLAGPDGSYSLGVSSTALTNVQICRVADSASDTLAADIGIIGVLIHRTD